MNVESKVNAIYTYSDSSNYWAPLTEEDDDEHDDDKNNETVNISDTTTCLHQEQVLGINGASTKSFKRLLNAWYWQKV